MLSRMNVNGGMWGLEDATDLHCNNDENLNLPTFKAMLDAEEWFTSHSNTNNNDIATANMNNANSHPEGPCFNIDMKDFGCYSSLVNPNPEPPNMLLQHAMNSCSSSPTSIFSLDPSQVQSFLAGGSHHHQHHLHHHHAPQLSDVAGSSAFQELACEGLVSSNNASSNSSSNSYLYGGLSGGIFRQLSPSFAGSSPRTNAATPTPNLSSPHSQMGGSSTSNLSPRMMPASNLNLSDTGLFASNNHNTNNSNNNLSNLLGLSSLVSPRLPAPLNFSSPKMLRPLEICAPVGAQPTLFQKRAALRHTSLSPCATTPCIEVLDEESPNGNSNSNVKGKRKLRSVGADKKEEEDVDESNDGSGVQYDSDDVGGNNNSSYKVDQIGEDGLASAGGTGNAAAVNNNSNGGGDKGKKKGLPAKNLMAERRRRKKLNDRLYMLRSVVPKISKMDRASILGDAIEYLKELLQKINDLHNELESTSQGPVLPGASNFHPLTPTTPSLPCRVKEECPTSLPSPNAQPARVEVRMREGHALNIHMFCARRPGLLLSTMRALDGLGLDVQQAVISCFNGFALDVFRAEQAKEGEIAPEEIKAVLLHTASCHTAI